MAPIATTTCGALEGVARDGVLSFLGIPFAKPPAGKRRFRSPERPDAWTGVRGAKAYGPSAPQGSLGGMVGPLADVGETSEDCLYLNVWTPSTDGDHRPVMVWIHGGAFVLGSGSQAWYGGDTLARRGDVVVVTVNYRLGALGFLHLAGVLGDDFAGTGNAGILDQIAALEWVRDNIASFGGDPGNVTIFGESAGGMSVGTLLGAPRARGLFRRAIPQSGAASNASTPAESGEVTERVLRALGLDARRATELFDVPVERILEAQGGVMASMQLAARGIPFQPVVDDTLLDRVPIDAVRDGLSKDVSLLVGTNLDEMKLFEMMTPNAFADETALIARVELFGAGAGRALVEAYRAARGPDVAELWSAIWTDAVFRMPAIRLAEAQSAHQEQTYAYLFTRPSAMPQLGACHVLEIPFVFGNMSDPFTSMLVGDAEEARPLATAIQDAWIAFARTGDPSHPGLPDWPRYDASRRATMILDRTCVAQDDPAAAERLAWEGVS